MSLSSTPEIPVKLASCSSSGRITFIFKPPYLAPLFIAAIYVFKDSAGPPVVGRIAPGHDGTHGGRIDLQVNDDVYEYLRRYAATSSTFTVSVGYDTQSLDPIEITCTVMQVALATESTLRSIDHNVEGLIHTGGQNKLAQSEPTLGGDRPPSVGRAQASEPT